MKRILQIICLYFMMSLALQNCAHNKNKKSTESSTEESAQSYRKLTPPIQLKLADIALINTNIIAYSSAMQNIAYPQTYSKLLIDNDLKNFIDSNNCEGIRIGKGLYKNSTDLTYSQNFIIKFINKNGTTRTTDPAFVAYDKENICQIKCSETDIITSSKPNTVNISKIANATSTNFIENYVGADDREKDTVNSFIIPKLILSEMYTTNVTFIKIYNAINDTKQRLFYVLSYNSSGDLVIDKSFSLDDTYSCPNYCDTVFYIFSNTVTK